MKLFLYKLGAEPYGDGDGASKWGEREGKFIDVETALRQILIAHPFPTALTGRYKGVFFPGVSIAGAPDTHVIQVWSTEPQAFQNLKEYGKAFPKSQPGHWPHVGDGTNVGLLREIHVAQVAEYQIPVPAGYLTDGSNTAASASPGGRFALSFSPHGRNQLQVRMLQVQLAGVAASHSLGESLEAMKGKMNQFREGLGMMQAYLGGTHGMQILARGDRAPREEPYSVFQSRLYLEEELGLIANLVEMDHRDMGKIDDWLMSKPSRWQKLLPLPKCMLVTRISRHEKSYMSRGMSAIEECYHNHFNMESLVWIRDGENVWRFATDVKFDERVFPSGDDVPALITAIQDRIWKQHWSGQRRREMEEWNADRGHDEKKSRTNPADEAEPLTVIWEQNIEYKTLHQFLESPHYTPALDSYIRARAKEGARQHQREMMPFAMLLQGIIDNQPGLLHIPPGTDIFDSESHHKYLRLVNDFSYGIADSKNRKQWEALTNIDALQPGTRIIGWRWGCYTEKYSKVAKWNIGKRDPMPLVFTVASVAPAMKKEAGEHRDVHFKRDAHNNYERLSVHEYALTKRWVDSPFTKVLSTAFIGSEHWLPIDLPISLAEKLLDDRDWKRENRWAVPILAQWSVIKKQIPPVAENAAPVALSLKSLPDFS